MTECFLPPPSSPSEHRRAEHGSGLTRTPSSEEISPTKFPGLYRTGEPSPPHDILHEPPDTVSDDEKDHGELSKGHEEDEGQVGEKGNKFPEVRDKGRGLLDVIGHPAGKQLWMEQAGRKGRKLSGGPTRGKGTHLWQHLVAFDIFITHCGELSCQEHLQKMYCHKQKRSSQCSLDAVVK